MIFPCLGLTKCNINFRRPKMSSNIHELTTRIARLNLMPSNVDELTTRFAKLNLIETAYLGREKIVIKSKMSKLEQLITKVGNLTLNNTSYIGTESQSHGKVWEREVGLILGASIEEMQSIDYISSTDLPSRLNRMHHVDNHCKATGSKLVCMGSAMNVFKHLKDDHTHLTIVKYKQRSGWKEVENTYQLEITGMLNEFFGDITYEDLLLLETSIKSLPPGRVDKATKDRVYNELKTGLQRKSGIISLNPKVDSKTQRRLQCSFNIEAFFHNFGGRCIYIGTGNKFYDGYLSPRIESKKRERRSTLKI